MYLHFMSYIQRQQEEEYRLIYQLSWGRRDFGLMWDAQAKPGGTGCRQKSFLAYNKSLQNSLSNVVCFMSTGHSVLMMWLFSFHIYVHV